MSDGIVWEGDLREQLGSLGTSLRPFIERALQRAAEELLDDSNRYAPKDTGELVDSGSITVDDLTATVRYTARHAVPQHEKTEYRHPRGGQAKFLQQAMDDAQSKLLGIVGEEVRIGWGS